ncbi:MAG: nucleotidyltransferase domain-containing protein [Rickettsiales bacterium]|nr:nucleotidyltransferase domain-containing protein [Rickettsiales bacterium]
MVIQDYIQELASLLSANKAVEKLYLFGSRANGTAREFSDIDIAISCPKATLEDWKYYENILDNPPTLNSIDLVDYDSVDKSLRKKINQEGLVLYEKK